MGLGIENQGLDPIQYFTNFPSITTDKIAFYFVQKILSSGESSSLGKSPKSYSIKKELDIFVEYFYEFC